MRDAKISSASLEPTDTPDDLTSYEIGNENTLSRDESLRGHGQADTAAVGKIMHAIEILSSDQSSDDCLLTCMKYTKTKKVKHPSTSITNSGSLGRPLGGDTKGPSVSRESSHIMNYSYESDTNSLGGRSQDIETPFVKLSWPRDEWDDHEGGTGMKIESLSAPSSNENHKKFGKESGDVEASQHEGDESDEEEIPGIPVGPDSDREELPVLPKVPVKRKLLNEAKGCDKRVQKWRGKSGSPQMKKQRTPQIDASVITQLEFGRRPENCVSIATS
jgi:hypothetical protein